MGDRDELCGRRLGEFILRERIAEGGFGAVYRSEQPLLGREAVVKVLQRGLRHSEVVIQRFMREAQLASRLDHPYAAHVYAFGVDQDDGLMWIAMELVQGTTLDRWLRERGKLPLDRLVPFFERVAEVVHTAHERGIVHRDLKPSNIMVIERAGRLLPKLLDLGIAKLHEPDLGAVERESSRAAVIARTSAAAVAEQAATVSLSRESPPKLPSQLDTLPPSSETPRASLSDPLTRADATMGSPPYMSPEQWIDASLVGPRSDLYSLAIVAYEALAGRRPFSAPTLAGLAHLHCEGDVPPLGNGFSPALDALFRRALAKRPEDRPATALELVAELRVAAGFDTAPTDLPRLHDGVRDSWLADAPQPLAEAVAALDGARNVHQGRDAARELVRGLLRYLVAIALAARAQVRTDRDEPALLDLLRAIRRRELDDTERLHLLRLLVRPFDGRRGAHPIPELVDVVATGALDPIVALHLTSDAGGTEVVVRSQLAQQVGELTRLLRAAAFVLDYALVVRRGNVAERWVGLRRHRRALATVPDAELVDRQPVLIDGDGRAVVLAWPVIQVLPPEPGAELELFVLDGYGRAGARLTAAPGGFEHHDSSVWDWLGEHVIGEANSVDEAASDDRPPYLGLASFSEADADRFVGREREVDVFLNRLRQRPLQIVVGASGAGKSSFVQAGVVPMLPAGWRTVTMRPGATPLATLATRLATTTRSTIDLRPVLDAAPAAAAALVAHAAGDGAIVVVIDQLEELFTLCADAGERERFVAALVHLGADGAEHTRVICTLRDDFLMHAEALSPLRASMSPGLYLLGNPSHEDLVRTIVEPARRAGYELSDSELAHDMVVAVADRPGALALVSFTALRLWELRDRRFRQLTRNAYDAMGGVGGALRQHAETVLETLTADEQRLARDAFRHLVTAEGTRAVLTVRELRERLANPRGAVVIDKLVAARLLTITDGEDEQDVEIVHEALIAAWPRLQQWVRDDADGARMRDELRAVARQWHERDRPRGLLWRDDVLAELERWRRTLPALTDIEVAFANASRLEARRARRIRRGLAVAGFVVLAAAVVVLFELREAALRGELEAQASTDRVEKLRSDQHAQLVLQLESQGRQALLAGDIHAADYLVKAYDEGLRGRGLAIMLHRAVASRAAEIRSLHVGSPVRWVEISPDGTQVLTVRDGNGVVSIWDAATGAERVHDTHGGAVWDARFDRGGTRVAIGGDVPQIWNLRDDTTVILDRKDRSPAFQIRFGPDNKVVTRGAKESDAVIELWDARTGKSLGELGARDGNGAPIDVTDDRIATTDGNTVVLWDWAGRLAGRLTGHANQIPHVVFGADRETIASASADGTARLWEVASGTTIAVLSHGGVVDGIAIDPRGRFVVTTSDRGAARLWDRRGTLLSMFAADRGRLTSTAFSPTGDAVVIGDADGNVCTYDVPGGALRDCLQGHAAEITTARYGVDGRTIVTASLDGTARIWRADSRRFFASLPHKDRVGLAAFAPDRASIATTDYAGVVYLWDAVNGTLRWSVTAHAGPISSVDFDGTEVLTVGSDAAKLWSASDGAARNVIRGDRGDYSYGRLTPDSILLATATGAIEIRSRTGSLKRTIDAHHGPIALFAISDDRRRVATAASDGAAVFDVTTGERVLALVGHDGAVSDIVFGPGGSVVTVGSDRTARIWGADGRCRHVIKSGGFVAYPRFDAKGRLLTAHEDGNVRVWNVVTGGLVATLRGHSDRVLSLEMSPDNEMAVSAGRDGTLVVWDLDRLGAVLRVQAHLAHVDFAAFDATGSAIVTSSWDRTAKLWRLETGALDDEVRRARSLQ